MSWDKTKPAGSTKVRLSDNAIRDNWSWIESCLDDEHNFPTDGTHKDITCTSIKTSTSISFSPPIATPSNVVDTGKLYGKDVGGKIELHYLDEDGNEVQLTSAGVSGFPAGTKIPFYQDSAPAGWTYFSGVTDRVLAVKGGATYVTGGAVAGSWTIPNHTLSVAEMPSHNHGGSSGSGGSHSHTFGGTTPRYGSGGVDGSFGSILAGGGYSSSTYVTINSAGSAHTHTVSAQGGSGAHNHGAAYRPAAAVIIICSKN